MKKNKTTLGISTLSTSHLSDPIEDDITKIEKQSKAVEDNILVRKN